MSDVFEEVEEGLRQDKTGLLWSKYGPLVYAIGFAIIAAVGINEYLKSQSTKQAEARIIEFETAREALLAGDYAVAEERFSVLVEENSDLSAMAANYLARVRLEGGGDLAGAETALSSQAKSDGGPFERLATLKTAYAKAESLSLAELEALLGGLLADEDGLGILAKELIAAKAYEEGDYARARREFSYLRFAPNAPQGVVIRSQVALAVLPVIPAIEEETLDVPADIPAEDTPNDEESGE